MPIPQDLSDAYHLIRTVFDKIDAHLDLLNQFNQMDDENDPSRETLKELSGDLFNLHQKIANFLHMLDSDIDDSQAKYFKSIPEQQLWERRTKAYSYKL